ncbi:MAG: NAD(P)/FAD-dependent oxidoreductase [Reyranella sp.]|uniref:NAD(P)/FAD-dependent oxidoreductase n=1 Tax=Reyranella sp. TaxID=1929291 RepID=UPI00272F0185|nr:NAD(P)/FAD-dependent oxidoreductase [Reyranella sp.]MDP1963642.1 NAD(P)/FAD-dependent oxidoreductase [Reyranella sp.]MDP2378451.1 NAD(P)/FAD-dependent oxidoreductase [Reyranella sp.]
MTTRRTFLKGAAVLGLAPAIASAQSAAGKVVVIGGGFAGATAARTLKALEPRLDVTLVEPNAVYIACPFSNAVLANLREISQQEFRYDGLKRAGVTVAATSATTVDATAKTVTLADGNKLTYDRLVMSPGIDFNWSALPGYDEAATQKMPHAWKAGAQTVLLRNQLQAMEDGGLVVMSAPANPYRCPPGPYERASLIAYWMKIWKPKSKLLLLDAKDGFSKQRLFQNGWAELYPGMIEWVPLSKGGKVTSVDPATLTLTTEFGSHKAAVANVIPPQRAGAIAAQAGVADRTGWCPVEPVAFESTLKPGIHVLGDAAIMGGMPKSAFAANAQAKVCAAAIVELLAGRKPQDPILINTCYSLLAADYGISVAGVYRPDKGQLTDVPGAGGVSALDAVGGLRGQEALYASSWFRTITAETFG